MKSKMLLHNARVYTQARDIVVDSIAVRGNRIAAVGNRLQHDPDLRSYCAVDLKGRTVVPGFVDAHTHFYYFALSLGQVSLDGLDSLEACLAKVRAFSGRLGKKAWVIGDGFAPARFRSPVEPDRYQLDKVTGERPAFIFSKDQHSAWVNSRALALAGIDKNTPDPDGGEIVRLNDGTPIGIVREQSGYDPVLRCIQPPSQTEINRRYGLALECAYKKGVTGVHSFDGPEGFAFFVDRAAKDRLGLRINYYPPARLLPKLRKSKTHYGDGDEFLRIAGVKLFADGSLGSQTACCFNKYIGTRYNRGIEVTAVSEMRRLADAAAKLGLPCAIHAIGDRAVSNVIDVFEEGPRLRHRIEHLQMIRRKDIPRLKRLDVIASMQPSHCPSDIDMVRRLWGRRGGNAYIFRTLTDAGIRLAFGSDVPIEPLDPIAGIAAAVRRARPKSRDVFYPEQRLTASEALFNFTAGPAIASGQEATRSLLLPGFPADLVILDMDITRVAPSKISDTRVLATILDGKLKYCHPSLSL